MASADRNPTSPALEAVILRSLTQLWERGWEPADVVHVTRRDLGSKGRAMASVAVRASAAHLRTAHPTMHPAWLAQFDALGRPLPTPDGWLPAAARAAALDPTQAVRTATHLAALLSTLPSLSASLPPPSAWETDGQTRRSWALYQAAQDAATGMDPRVLGKIRALLAKAESTTFPEEAEALTAKAQELITRHAVDRVLLAATTGSVDDQPLTHRVHIDDPYASQKSTLLSEIASANHSRSVYTPQFGIATLVGFAADLRAIELLFTSLLVQATAAMVQAGDRAPSGGRARSRGFRSTFLSGYAIRIGQRLALATHAVETAADAASEGSLLPVLSLRDEAIDRATSEAFPRLRYKTTTVSDGAGWSAGTAAADRADLGGDRRVDGLGTRALGPGRAGGA